jgi:hypothetical protein
MIGSEAVADDVCAGEQRSVQVSKTPELSGVYDREREKETGNCRHAEADRRVMQLRMLSV